MTSEPILPGFYPDPTICRVGEDYYLVNSSFEYFPGAPLWHSRDLVSWTQLGHVLDRRSQFDRGDGSPSAGLYAGTLRHHDGRFWYVTTNVGGSGGQLLVSSHDPAGPWSEPVLIPAATGIDPDLAWDADGACFLTWKAMSRAEGEIGILQSRLDTQSGELLDPPYPVWQGSGLSAAEGPHLYFIDGYWYLLLAEGGTERGHAVTIARGRHPRGPFEGCPVNPVLSHRSSIDPVQNTGHADLVQTPAGDWAAVYLGVRTRGWTPGYHVLGRETFLAGVQWRDGWPAFDVNHFQVPQVETGFMEDFAATELDHRWVVPGGDADSVIQRDAESGILVRPPLPDGEPWTGLLCTRVRDLRWRAEASIEGAGRFLVRVDHRHYYGLAHGAGFVEAIARIGDLDSVVARVSVPSGPVDLRIEAVDSSGWPVPSGNAGPDQIVLSLVQSGVAEELARLDGRYLSTEVASGFTGRVLALGATAEPLRVRSLRYDPA